MRMHCPHAILSSISFSLSARPVRAFLFSLPSSVPGGQSRQTAPEGRFGCFYGLSSQEDLAFSAEYHSEA
jgi:hypothetical protein